MVNDLLLSDYGNARLTYLDHQIDATSSLLCTCIALLADHLHILLWEASNFTVLWCNGPKEAWSTPSIELLPSATWSSFLSWRLYYIACDASNVTLEPWHFYSVLLAITLNIIVIQCCYGRQRVFSFNNICFQSPCFKESGSSTSFHLTKAQALMKHKYSLRNT